MNKYQRLQKWVFSMAVNTGHTTNVDKEYNDLLKELVDKATPMKPATIMYQGQISNFNCPVCEYALGYKVIGFLDKYKSYCPYCGQALDWSEDE